MTADYRVVCHDPAHADTAPAYTGGRSEDWTAWHWRSESTLIDWPSVRGSGLGGALWHCPEHSDHVATLTDCKPRKGYTQ